MRRRNCSTVLSLVLACGAALGGSAVQAQAAATDEIAAVRELVLHAEYRPALTRVLALLERTDLTAAERNAGLEALATVHLALRDEEAASVVLTDLYARDPGHRLRDEAASPFIRAAFLRAREASHPVVARMESVECGRSRDGRVRIRVRVTEAASAVASVQAAARAGAASWGSPTVSLRPDGMIVAELDDVPERAPIEYHLTALAPSGVTLGVLGSPDEALRCQAYGEDEAGAGTSLATPVSDGEWWPWVVGSLIVLAAGAAAVAIGFVLDGEGQRPTLGSVTFPLIRF